MDVGVWLRSLGLGRYEVAFGENSIDVDKNGRVCRGVDLHLPYVDVIIQRYEAATGNAAVLVDTGETVDWLAARKAREATSGLRAVHIGTKAQAPSKAMLTHASTMEAAGGQSFTDLVRPFSEIPQRRCLVVNANRFRTSHVAPPLSAL